MNTITRWNPIRELSAVQSLVDRMLEDVEGTTSGNGFRRNLALDITETKDAYSVVTALPGVDAENIEINMHDQVLTIEAEIPENVIEEEGTRVLLRERSYGRYSRQVRLPQPVNADAIEANYNDGVLSLTLPKAEHALPRTIKVNRS